MNNHESKRPVVYSLNTERLKELPNDQFAKELLDEAFDITLKYEGDERVRLEKALLDARHESADDQKAEQDAYLARLRLALAQRIVDESTDHTDIEQAYKLNALDKMEDKKRTYERGLAEGVDADGEPWNDQLSAEYLISMCDAQGEAGITYLSDYIRNQALHNIQRQDFKGLVLLRNALAGDTDSFGPANLALVSSVIRREIKLPEAHHALKIIGDMLIDPPAELTEVNTPAGFKKLRETAVYLLSALKELVGTTPYNTYEFVTMAGRIASLVSEPGRPPIA